MIKFTCMECKETVEATVNIIEFIDKYILLCDKCLSNMEKRDDIIIRRERKGEFDLNHLINKVNRRIQYWKEKYELATVMMETIEHLLKTAKKLKEVGERG